jgi:hypothetical protein
LANGKCGSVIPLYLYIAIAVCLLPQHFLLISTHLGDFISLPVICFWVTASLLPRAGIIRRYLEYEGRSEKKFSLLLTIIFSVFYLNYRLRPDFPLLSDQETLRLNV